MAIWKARRVAFVAAALAVAAYGPLRAQEPTVQGWTEQQRSEWYEATQGSRLIPYAWLMALEQPGTDRLFLHDEHIAAFRYLPRTTSSGARLPLGFALDRRDDRDLRRTRLRWRSGQDSDEPWVGLNCAACHTGEITYAGRTVRIDGGPTLADFQGFMESFNLALARTAEDAAKWDRFAARVLQSEDNPANRVSLRDAFDQLRRWQADQLRMNHTPLRYGFGRLDAFGHIFNKVALLADPERATPNPADAPVSYPYLWNVQQLPHVQYNAIAANSPIRSPFSGSTFDVGALGRNTGEVVGVFADVDMRRDPGLGGYRSSVDVDSLIALEQRLMRLEPPRWPAHFPPIDGARAAEGERLFRARCAACHLPLPDASTRVPDRISTFNPDSAPDPADPSRRTPPGTDPWMACNAYTYQSAAGALEGLPAGYVSGPALGAVADLSDMLKATVGGVLVGAKYQVVGSAFRTFFFGDRPPRVVPAPPPVAAAPSPVPVDPRQARLDRCMRERSVLLAYKARPLTGIWATAPYLHNGSVPNLYQLLLPPDQRVVAFRVGTREFDPRHVGYVTDAAAPGNAQTFSVIDAGGRPIPGNSNAGHDYGNAELDEGARLAILEYMKTL